MRFTLVTYNIHKCIGGLDRRFDPDRVIDALAHHDPDFVLLQEVDFGARRSRRIALAQHIGEALGLPHHIFYANVQLSCGGSYGNAILSRYPVVDSINVDLTLGPKKARSMLHSVVELPGPATRRLHVCNVHLGLANFERRQQIRRALGSESFDRLRVNEHEPVVIAGDFNDIWRSQRRQLLSRGFRARSRVRTFPAYAPMLALDAVYVRGAIELEDVAHGPHAHARKASDHLPLVAQLRVIDAGR